MGNKLFYVVPPEHEPWLHPQLNGSAQEAALRTLGFTPIDVSTAQLLQRAGATLARTRTDGVHWPLARYAADDGFARWAHHDDVALYKQVADTVLRVFKLDVASESALNKLMTLLASNERVTPELMATIESMIRLGADMPSVFAVALEAIQ